MEYLQMTESFDRVFSNQHVGEAFYFFIVHYFS